MRLRADWTTHLHNFRKRELDIIFRDCPPGHFESALELGAGDGFQSRILASYARRLVATEYNEARLERREVPGVFYEVCDAERVDEYFPPHAFDLVFASNLFEHLPHPEQALRGIRRVLRDDGVVILVMPSVFWKCTHVGFFYPNLILSFFEKVLIPGKIAEWWGRYVLRRRGTPSVIEVSDTATSFGNNQKGRVGHVSSRGIFFPAPHGVSSGNIEEFAAFRVKRWAALFEAEGFSVCTILRGPVASGYGFGLDRIRTILERLGFASEYAYVLKKTSATEVKYPFTKS